MALPVLLLLVLSWLPLPQSGDSDTRFREALRLQQAGDLPAAEAAYRTLLAEAPENAEARANLGAVLMRLGRYHDAVAAYEEAYRVAPHLKPILLNLGIAHHRTGEYSRALDALREFLRAHPSHRQALQLTGLSLLELGRDAEAIDVLNAAGGADLEDPAALYGLGMALLRSKKAGVGTIASRLASVPEGEPASRLLRGQLYLHDLEFEKAVAELEVARSLRPDLPRLDYSLGLGLLKLGRNAEALAAFERELVRAPRDATTLYYIAYLLESAERWAEARTRVEQALELDPESAEAAALRGKILMKQNKPEEALPYLERAVARHPEDSEKRFLLARAYQQLGRTEDARREFAEVQRLKARQLEKDRARTPKP